MKKRTLVIGDIHGAFLALEQVLKRATLSSQDELIFVGDYVDGWSQSFEVIEFLMELEKNHTCIFLKGNHDIWCGEWLVRDDPDPTWLVNGGALTVESYNKADLNTKLEHQEFFERLQDYHMDDDKNLFVHAGFTATGGPKKEMFSKTLSWDRTLWELAVAMDKRIGKDSLLYPKRLKHFKEIFIGHTQTVKYNTDEPMNAANVWNVDTGAASSGKLTVMDISTKEFWQSDLVQMLYPGENGRN